VKPQERISVAAKNGNVLNLLISASSWVDGPLFPFFRVLSERGPGPTMTIGLSKTRSLYTMPFLTEDSKNENQLLS
jgi:hypothetical protein